MLENGLLRIPISVLIQFYPHFSINFCGEIFSPFEILSRRFSNTLQRSGAFYCLSLSSDSIRGNNGIR
ncbi:hypothetical protein E4413_15870 [Leptospira interrogans]|uniref:Uncharacterized protein n=3 Tax=Leptospira interrogans TaxID=173 RepID=A0AAP9W9F1_LEPIR|nr:hypothetical protein BRAT_02795 [Leptospira interrogans serovar Bratislava]EKO27025.1 hypothetical protein LEP1GSC104_0906 [Leptospira interrogans str. UI 12621]EMJ35475.1 hypothetical protein LEP1GSC079_4615 [Leptospira interrogans str. FPW1039]KAA1290253.1 hypothetical protein C4X99_07450 [Leptospira interrogans serovar Geyaweera]MCR8639204.1 hypothetical protein [Leptospira interrogans serovar Ricardi]MCR8648627.1 hypothetical protein [Leptospira interrogans serovar Bataviae]QCO34373.1 